MILDDIDGAKRTLESLYWLEHVIKQLSDVGPFCLSKDCKQSENLNKDHFWFLKSITERKKESHLF